MLIFKETHNEATRYTTQLVLLHGVRASRRRTRNAGNAMSTLRSLARAARRKTEGKPVSQDSLAFHYAACAWEATQIKRNSHLGKRIVRKAS